MLSRVAFALCLFGLWGCGSSSSSATSTPGPLVDNTKWVPTSEGEELFGAPPEGSVCELMPIDCPEFPWPDGKCIDFAADSTCIASFVPECLDSLTVLSVYTRMPDPQVPLCNWITLEQPSVRAIRAGDQVEVRARHSQLNAPVPGEARMTFVVGDEIALDYSVLIPSDFKFPSAVWAATKDYPVGTPLLWHVENHGANEYMLIEVNILDEDESRPRGKRSAH